MTFAWAIVPIGLAFVLSPLGASGQATPTPSPSPAPAATPAPAFSYEGHVRAYYFTRQNCSGYSSNPCVPDTSSSISGTYKSLNQAAFNAAITLHGAYSFAHSPWSLRATYVYANPLGVNGPCDFPANYGNGGACQQYPSENNNYRSTDTTLPPFTLSTLAEAYVLYKNAQLDVTAGDQLFSSPWAGPSDSRIKAAYYQGFDAQYRFARDWTIGVSRMTQWENRTSSNFNKSNLIVPLGSDGSIVNPTTGFLLLKTSYTHGSSFNAGLDYYQFYDIASLLWFETKLTWARTSTLKPYIAIQFGSESNAGRSLAGKINSGVLGAEIGASLGPNVDVTVGYDQLPWRSATVALPAGVECKNNVISGSAPTGGTGYWLPTGGTPNCVKAAAGTAIVYYGGIASPYTDSYSSSPLFTTSESQDMAERRSAGNSAALTVTIRSTNKQIRAIVTRTLDNFTNGAGAETTWGTGIDVEYYFNKVGDGPYRGLSLRNRWKQRTQTYTQLWGGTPLFNYSRVQFEYNF
ncbi:MAG: hypothetical protein ACXVAF_18490 [Vulcanimicrobiaceae bacterium]